LSIPLGGGGRYEVTLEKKKTNAKKKARLISLDPNQKKGTVRSTRRKRKGGGPIPVPFWGHKGRKGKVIHFDSTGERGEGIQFLWFLQPGPGLYTFSQKMVSLRSTPLPKKVRNAFNSAPMTEERGKKRMTTPTQKSRKYSRPGKSRREKRGKAFPFLVLPLVDWGSKGECHNHQKDTPSGTRRPSTLPRKGEPLSL